MPRDIQKYLSFYKPGEKLGAYTGTQLARGGITDMEVLCALLKTEPEKLCEMRNIGPKSMELIRRACASYQNERGGPA